MSEATRQLGKMARELALLLRDLRDAERSGSPLGEASAPRSLGDVGTVPFTVFFEYIAGLWLDWAGLLRRWQRYTGLPDDQVPARWKRLYRRASKWVLPMPEGIAFHRAMLSVDQKPATGKDLDASPHQISIESAYEERGYLLNNGDFLQAIQSAWMADFGQRVFGTRTFADPRAAFHAALEADARLRLITRLTRGIGWEEIDAAARAFEAQVRGAMEHLSPEVRDAVQWHLGQYRRTLLRLSWLEDSEEGRRPDGSTLLRSEIMEMDWLVPLLSELEIDADTRGILQEILRRAGGTIFEIGYDAFVDDLRSGEIVAGPNGVTGGEINLIPSKSKGVCHRILMAVASGKSRRALPGLPRVLQEIQAHLVTCSPDLNGQTPNREATRVVILLTDAWDSKQFNEEHRTVFLAHKRKGVRFITLQVGSDGKTLSAIERDLA